MKIVVYSKPHCVMCRYTKEQLDKMELTYEDIDVTQDAAAANDVQHMGFGEHPTMPIVVVSNSRRADKWSGFKIDRIRSLRSTGDY